MSSKKHGRQHAAISAGKRFGVDPIRLVAYAAFFERIVKSPEQGMTNEKNSRRISRREFAGGGALAAASAALPAALLPEASAQTAMQQPTLSTAGQAEVDAQVSAVIRRYGNLLSDAEKLDIRRLLNEGQKPLEAMRAFRLGNADQPGNVLRLYPDVPPMTAKTSHSERSGTK
jgi:hypothetical protein